VRVEVTPSARPDGPRNLTGVLPGGSGLEILLAAHYDTAPASPGGADDAAGCAVVLEAATRLARLPRRHTVRVLLFDREEERLDGSRAWIEARARTPGDGGEGARVVLAALGVDLVGWSPGGRGVLRLARAGESLGPPAWLAHAVVRSSAAIGAPISVATGRWSPFGQLRARAFSPTDRSDADAFVAAGIPAATLTEVDRLRPDPHRHLPTDAAARLDAGALERGVNRLTAATLRLDALAGRPRDDDRYLAVAGRILSRRDLYWINLLAWTALVLAGIPGRWRGTAAGERRRSARAYLPGFAARFLYLAAILALPVFSTVLLLPAALVGAASVRLRLPAKVAVALAALPWALLTGVAAWAAAGGRLGSPAGAPAAWLLLVGAFGLMVRTLPASDPSTGPAAWPGTPPRLPSCPRSRSRGRRGRARR
jgi:hypothetical protein